MKSLVIAVAVLVCVVAHTAFAQDELHKGVYVLGGSASYTSSTTTFGSAELDTHTLTLAPQFSIFVTDQLMVGLGLSYVNISATESAPEQVTFIDGSLQYDNTISQSSDEFVFGPTVRYYLPMRGWYPFLGATFQASSSGFNGASSRDIQFLAGTDLFVAHGVAIEPMLSYLTGSQGAENFHTFQIGAGVSYFISTK